MMTEAVDSRSGHRERLRQRFLQGGLEGFLDYEIIELLLTLGTPRKDCKQMARDTIAHFGSMMGVFNATYEELQAVKGIGPSNAFGLKLFQAVGARIAKENMPDKIDFHSTKAVAEYLKQRIGNKQQEHFVVLYLDTNSKLIADEILFVGILNASLVHPREVFKPALDHHAASIIISHNHPSGTVEPSRDDREVTKQLVDSGRMMGIEVRDHIIVTAQNHFSFAEELLL